jgi:hypothetical protein
MSTFAKFWRFAATRKKYWMLPLLTTAAILLFLLVLVKGASVTPFVYKIF